MSAKPPRILSASSRAEEVFNDFQREVLAEKAATLERSGRALEAAPATLRAADAHADRDALVQKAAGAAHAYLIQREVCGIHGLGAPLEDFGVPGEVRVRIGCSVSRTAGQRILDCQRENGNAGESPLRLVGG